MKFMDTKWQERPDNRLYICADDLLKSDFMLGIAKTIIEWKEWLIKDRFESLCAYNDIVNDEDAKKNLRECIDLKQEDVIPYIENLYDIKIIVLEGNRTLENTFLVMDEHKLVNEKELRKMLLLEETNDIINNVDDYVNKDLPLDEQLRCIKTALDGDIDVVIEMANSSWNIPIVKVKRG